jgi:hypothetical protein
LFDLLQLIGRKSAIGALLAMSGLGFAAVVAWLLGKRIELVQPIILGAVGGASLCFFGLALVALLTGNAEKEVESSAGAEGDLALFEVGPRLSTYEAYRDRVVNEDRLINERLCWMILSEPMLLGGYLLLFKEGQPNKYGLIMAGLAVCGLLIALLTYASIKAAHLEILSLKTEYNDRSKASGGALLELTGESGRHKAGHMLTITMPFMVVALWVAAGVYSFAMVYDDSDKSTPPECSLTTLMDDREIWTAQLRCKRLPK